MPNKNTKETKDKKYLSLEIVIGLTSFLVFLALLITGIIVMNYDKDLWWITLVLIIIGFIEFIASCLVALRIEQLAGYYECSKCGHRYTPTFKQVLWARHIGRKRYMNCPHCQQKTWQNKGVFVENEQNN